MSQMLCFRVFHIIWLLIKKLKIFFRNGKTQELIIYSSENNLLLLVRGDNNIPSLHQVLGIRNVPEINLLS